MLAMRPYDAGDMIVTSFGQPSDALPLIVKRCDEFGRILTYQNVIRGRFGERRKERNRKLGKRINERGRKMTRSVICNKKAERVSNGNT